MKQNGTSSLKDADVVFSM